ncbi:hypothetical protein [Brevibacillus parabrevis]|uniref:hypothetical protein n=1 Tax=Brevibacillus parabrevis TaxID=54914 RepID=UPI0028D4A7FE|nr:hypothetical protein [Brevibacillus parabrevis]
METIRQEENGVVQSTSGPNDAPSVKTPLFKRISRGVRTLIFSIATLVLVLKVLSWIGIDLITPIDRALSQFSAQQKYVDMVREGHFAAHTDQKIGDAFDKFFGSPRWSAFDSDTGQKIVEFTGDCTYLEQKVKARMQFVVNPETGSFEIHTIGFNDIPQNRLMQAALLAKVFEGKEIASAGKTEANGEATTAQTMATHPEANSSPPSSAETTTKQQQSPPVAETQVGNKKLIEDAMYSYLVEIPKDTIGNVFNETLFADISWGETNGDIVFSGNYRGDIVEGEPSQLEFTFSYQEQGGYYHIKSMKFNGKVTNQEQIDYIVEKINYAIQ